MEDLQDTYKDTKIGRIPKDWEVEKIRDIIEDSLLGGNYKNGEGEKGIPLIKMGNLDRGKIKLNKIENIPETLVYDNKHILKEGDFLFNTRNTLELVGKVAIWRNELKKALYNSNLLKIDFNKSKVHSTKFMNYVFNSDLVIKKLRGLATGSTSVAAIYNKDLFKLKVPLPPLLEQQKIAAILSTVDEQISTTDKIIEKSKELKKGLMQKLFSEGLGHTEFKDTKIGRIPKEWEVVKIMDVAENLDSKRVPIKSEDRANMSGEYPYYGAQGIIDWVNQYLFDGDYLLVAEDGENVKSQKNDIAILVCGKFWVNNHAHVLRCKGDYSQIFLSYYLNQLNIRKYVSGSAQPKLNKGTLMKIQVVAPSLFEQQKIAAILSTLDTKIEKEQEQKTHLEALKKGLMQQLLTGKKRVKV